jgi:glycosyltransferase involved in cell wall biosynthesis
VLDLSNDDAEICVIGRPDLSHGIGSLTYSACELLSRSFPVCLLPTSPLPSNATTLVLPNGRPIPICKDVDAASVFFFVDVLWNGAYDHNLTLLPNRGFRVAQIAYDSDELPAEWVQILNERFDLALFTSRHLEEVARRSGVRVPVGTLPIGLDLDRALARKLPSPRGEKIRFGSVCAWHDRKNNREVLDGFLQEFGNDPSVELVIHSNLAIDESGSDVARMLTLAGAENVTLSDKSLTLCEKDALLDSFDVLVSASRGEGYSIPPREALARGCVLALSDIGAHQDLFGVPGVFRMPTAGLLPARYAEIDGLVCGRNALVDRGSIRRGLREAYEYVRSADSAESVRIRKARAAEFSFASLTTSYAEVVNPRIREFRTAGRKSSYVHLPETRAVSTVGDHARSLSARNWIVVPAHDGGFFSVFNAFISHLVWELDEERCQMVIPDWDMGRFLERIAPRLPESFCYGRQGDGNIWCHLFEPPFGLSEADMNDVELLARKCVRPERIWNEFREPLLTYVYAYDLYRRPWFPRFRTQYHRALRDHVRLLAPLQGELERMTDLFPGRFMIAAHVRHPSHVIEQPDGTLTATERYVDAIMEEVARKGLSRSSEEWGVFLATDQESVVLHFQERFGEHLHFFGDVRRTTVEEDATFERLSSADQARIGHQVQHRVAQSPDDWSVRMAWEVIRDAYAMSQCNVLLHVVSNVATAVSYMNPDIEMRTCSS